MKHVKGLQDASLEVIASTDHSAVVAMAKKAAITNTFSPDRLNIRLATANVEVVYRPGRIHKILDALSRLLDTKDT